MMRTTTFILLILALFVMGDSRADGTALPDSLPLPETEINNGLMALDLGLLTVGVWSPSRILGTDWAYIGFNTIEQNLKTGFVWDHDDWAMNQWGHPLHGGQFFNAARSNGYGFWGSIPFTMTGSMAWELFFEAEPPAINDLMTTVAGGVYMGKRHTGFHL